MAKKKKIPFRTIISVITFVLLVYVVYNVRDEIASTLDYLKDANIWCILLLIPEQLFMYYCAGQMFFSYMRAKRAEQKNVKEMSAWTLARISFELNFINHAIPSGGFSGLGYIVWRLGPYGATPGQTSFMYGLRYAITVCANQFQTILAIAVLALTSGIVSGAGWVIWLTLLTSAGIMAVITVIVVIASSKKRINWFVDKASKITSKIIKALTRDKIEKFFLDLHQDLLTARRNKRYLVKPIIWGIVYSFFEVAVFWVVGISMGHPEILPQIMIGEATASLIGGILPTPGGVGGYEGAMIFIMSTLGVDMGLATAVVITTRILILCGTIASGYGFYQHALATVGKPPKDQDFLEKK